MPRRIKLGRFSVDPRTAQVLLDRLTDLQTDWQVGDKCCRYKGRRDDPEAWSTVARIDADREVVWLANGEHMHISHMRRPLEPRP